MKPSLSKILILRFSSLGDIVMTTAMVRCLRKAYPKAKIDMIVREDFLDLINNNPHLDRKIGLSRSGGFSALRRLGKQLQAERYDLVYDAHGSLRSFYLMPILKPRYRARFQKHYFRRNMALTFKLPLLKGNARFLERFCTPLAPFGVFYDGQGPELFLAPKDTEFAGKAILANQKPSIGLIPSAQWEGKRWPWERFRTILRNILDQTDYNGLVFGGPGDWFCEKITEGFPSSRVQNFSGRLSIGQSAALLKHCRFVVANDTGMMHVADALGIPSVLVLGPTSGELGCLPFHPLSKVVERKLWCRPCSKNGQAPCIRLKRYCLEISEQSVWQQVTALSQQLGVV